MANPMPAVDPVIRAWRSLSCRSIGSSLEDLLDAAARASKSLALLRPLPNPPNPPPLRKGGREQSVASSGAWSSFDFH